MAHPLLVRPPEEASRSSDSDLQCTTQPSTLLQTAALGKDKALMTVLASKPRGPVDQLEDRYLGMVEAVGSNPTRSTFR